LRLSEEQIARFHRDGFVVIDQLSPAEEVPRIKATLDDLFQRRVGWKQGAQFDLVGQEDDDRALALPQLLKPADFAPELQHTQHRRNALECARQILGDGAEFWFEHAILKPPLQGAATPWHQDEAHRCDPGTAYDQISIWMPLQEATPENGCMKYMPGSHLGPVLDHRAPNGDLKASALECVGPFDPGQAIECPLPPGSAVLHHARTLHSAGPNQTAAPRLAYVLAFRGPLRPDPDFKGYPWNESKNTAAAGRARAWQARGGVIGQATRRLGASIAALYRRIKARLRA
jgi:ectoine hydroxylase-related dioxygenase (phytanoyl-CoA dioxygenase family)